MKSGMRFAGIGGSFTFLLIAVKSYLATDNPMQALLYGLAGAVVVGFIGFQIGHILTHPKGPPPEKFDRSGGKKSSKKLTGDEAFLEDIQS